MTLHLTDNHGREVHSKASGDIMIYSVNSLLTVIVKKDFSVERVIEILSSVPNE